MNGNSARAALIAEPESPPGSVFACGWGTALPAYRYRQRELAEFLGRSLDPKSARRVAAAFRGARIDTRHSVLPDFSDEFGRRRLFDGTPKTTAERLEIYAEEAPRLGEEAARAALIEAGIEAARVTHLLFVTCTGFVAPGPDRELVTRLGLAPSVRRVQIGFQGCSAGIVALRTAAEIVRGDPRAVVLVVAVELSSLHFQTPLSEEDVRGHALFADGAGAAVVAPASAASADGTSRRSARVRLETAQSLLLPDSEDEMSWKIHAHGFRMGLTSRVPDVLAASLPSFVESLGGADHWVIHPGGPIILDRIADSLGLDAETLSPSRRVLRRIGNVSSATVFFVFQELLAASPRGCGIAMAFGPGLTAEGLRFSVERGRAA